MQCPICHLYQDDGHTECARCGLIFEKYRQHRNLIEEQGLSEEEEDNASPREVGFISRLLFSVELQTNPIFFIGRLLVFAMVALLSWKFFRAPMQSNYVGASFMHLINLPFHEAGHVFFRPLGALLSSLGGTLGQLLMPLICFLVFLLKYKNTFGAAVAFWWLGENFLDIAPYINDARDLTLPLLGGNTGRNAPYGFHDWEFILNETGLIRYDHAIAAACYKIGIALMLISLIWGAYLLYKQYRNLDSSSLE